jgi:hypothetical protein
MTMETRVQPATWNLIIYQGDDFPFTFIIKDGEESVDLVETNASVRAQIRETELSPEILAEFATISLDADGTASLILTPEQTAILPTTGGKWDCEVTLNGVVRTFFKGSVTVLPEVTR